MRALIVNALRVALPFLLFHPIVASAQERLPAVRIGFVVDGPWHANERIVALKKDEIQAILAGEFVATFPPEAHVVGDYSLTGVRGALDSVLALPDLDLVIAAGAMASHVAATRTTLPVPVIAPYIIDGEIQGVPFANGASGVTNLSYLAVPWNTLTDLQAFREIVPFRKLAILSTEFLVEAIPELRERLQEAVAELAIDLQVVPVAADVDVALAAIDSDVEAVYVTSLLHLDAPAFDRLVAGLIEKKLPSFALFGRYHVERGLLAGLLTDGFFNRVARRIALNTQRILLGEAPESLPVAFAKDEALVINYETMRAIGVSPPWAVLTEAELINQRRTEVARDLTFSGVMNEAMTVNLAVAASGRGVAAGALNVRQATAALLPQVDLSLTGLLIDEDRAQTSFGAQPERSLTGSVAGSQLIFSEPVLADVSIQRHLQQIVEAQDEQLRLDIGQAAARAYLSILRLSMLERIQRENLKVTRTNLDLAQVRQKLGTARPAEVLRWESQIATNRRDVIVANANRNVAEMQLNRLLHRPLEESFALRPVTVDDPDLLSAAGRIFRYMADPASFRLLRAFLTEEARAASPELRALDESLAAQSRLATSAGLRFIAPSLGLSGEVSKRFATGGAGTGPGLGESSELTWNLGLKASLPLFAGGSRIHVRRQAYEELARLELERQAADERIEQGIRAALHLAGASYAAIGLAEDAERAAGESMALVTDAYSRGAASILDVIDAQNASLVANLTAANSVYGFLLDLIDVERALGRLTPFLTATEREERFDRLEAFFVERAE